MTEAVKRRADPRCEIPAASETGVCHCHAREAAKAGVTIFRLSLADGIRRAWSLSPTGAGAMTQTTIRTRVSILARISASVRRHQHKLSARIHAAADEQARQHGWTVIKTPGRFGFEARSYRDPRFDDRQRLSQRAGFRHTGSEAAPMSEAGE